MNKADGLVEMVVVVVLWRKVDTELRLDPIKAVVAVIDDNRIARLPR
jgi:hypothetical protein